MTPEEQLYMLERYSRLSDIGWRVQAHRGRFRITFPEAIRKNLGLVETAGIHVSSSNLEAAICAAETASECFQISSLSGKGIPND